MILLISAQLMVLGPLGVLHQNVPRLVKMVSSHTLENVTVHHLLLVVKNALVMMKSKKNVLTQENYVLVRKTSIEF